MYIYGEKKKRVIKAHMIYTMGTIRQNHTIEN